MFKHYIYNHIFFWGINRYLLHSPQVVICDKEEALRTCGMLWTCATRRHMVAQLVEALRYKPEGGGFDFQWCQCNL